MKLRNKRTGEIYEPTSLIGFDYKDAEDCWLAQYPSLAELNEEWEDYEEQEEYWYIRDFSITRGDTSCIGYSPKSNSDTVEYRKQIGNLFETKEEAEQAVKKLKAWKRLKDKGFRFKGCDDYHIDYELKGRCVWTDEAEKDLNLLFGGEE